MSFVQVILPLNVKGTYTYKVPLSMEGMLEVGMRVVVPFGGRKLYTGIVSEICAEESEKFQPKEIISVLDNHAILPEKQLKFWQWLSDYYLCNIGEVYRFAFPSSLKLESQTYIKRNENQNADFSELEESEIHLIKALEVKSTISLHELEAFIPRKEIFKTLNSLLEKRLILIDEKISEKYKVKEISYLKVKEGLMEDYDLKTLLQELHRAPKQKALFLKLIELTSSEEIYVKKSRLMEEGSFSSSQLKALIEKGFVEEFYRKKDRVELYSGELEEIENLSPAQKIAFQQIEEEFQKQNVVLLQGVPGSGKTHLYVAEIEKYVAKGKNALVLFPEVSLTKQIIQRLEKKYGTQLGFYHSKLTDFEKVEIWKKVKNNQLKIVLGTRNALFLPFQNLGLIVVDEEHDSMYKSTTVQPYFNAKDAAVVLGDIYRAKVLLGSATPSVESYYFSTKDKMGRVELNERFGGSSLPETQFIDFKEAVNLKTAKRDFSYQLLEQIQNELDRKKQVILLHNRRGYAHVLECESCGYVQYCSNCDVVMTYHKPHQELKCHYCGQSAALPKLCPSCHSENLSTKGLGIQQLEEEVAQLFPTAHVGRMDFDSMRKKYAYEKFFEKVESREIDIILGTQMVAKGLDFQHVDLVAIPKADSLLHVQDFRAEERAYQLLIQLKGRAGRFSNEGKMLLQTYDPTRKIFQNSQKDQGEMYRYFLEERKKFLYPPFVKLILIEIKHRKEDKAERAAKFYSAVLRKYLPEECILGPEKSPIAKLRNLYQFQILLKLPRGKKYKEYKNFLRKSQEEFEKISGYKSVKTFVFVDF